MHARLLLSQDIFSLEKKPTIWGRARGGLLGGGAAGAVVVAVVVVVADDDDAEVWDAAGGGGCVDDTGAAWVDGASGAVLSARGV